MNTLAPLLEILADPNHPAFAQALAQLEQLNPQTLPQEDFPALLAQLEQTITTLTAAKTQTAEELEKLRTQTRALQSYGKVK